MPLFRTALLALLACLALAGTAQAQPASLNLCIRQPTFVGCLPPAAAVTRDTVLPLGQGDKAARATVGQVMSQLLAADVTAALGFAPVGQTALNAKVDASAFLLASANLTVCASGCTFPTPLAAFSVARGFVAFGSFTTATYQIADGTYDFGTANLYTMENLSGLRFVGNLADPSRVVFQFECAGNNLSGVLAINGGRLGRPGAPFLDGVTLRCVGARVNRTDWMNQSFGSGVSAYGAGSQVFLGSHVVVDSFYYGGTAYYGGSLFADGATFRNAGDANVMGGFGGHVQCRGCTGTTAAHLNTIIGGVSVPQPVLGHNFLAEAGSTIEVDGSTASDGQISCFGAQTAGATWAHNTTASGCIAYGYMARQGGVLEATNGRVRSSAVGGFAQFGGVLNASGLDVAGSTFEGVLADGGTIQGASVKSVGNGAYGVRSQNGGSVRLFGSLSTITGNTLGVSYVETPAACTSPTTNCHPPSYLDIQ